MINLNVSEMYLSRVFFTVIALAFTFIISQLIKIAIDATIRGLRKNVSSAQINAKMKTIRELLKNISDIALYAMALLVILDKWGVNIGPILTGAGILGLAVSFGSQSLVKDVISGIFIILEDQFNVGDKVKIIDKYEGYVDRITLRLVVLRNAKGDLVYIPNSQITSVIVYEKKPPKV